MNVIIPRTKATSVHHDHSIPLTKSALFLSSSIARTSPHFSLRSVFIMSKIFSQVDVAEHKKADDLWIIVDEDVYDLTKFQTEHPGM